MFDVNTTIWIYVLGVIVGLIMTDARPAQRVGLALLWPVGPLAFLVTLAVLAGASFIAFPLVASAILAAVIAWWLWA